MTRSGTGPRNVAHDLGVGEVADPPLLVAREEPVEGDHRRELHLGPLGDAKRDHVEVVDRLRVASEEDQPAGVERVVDVGVVAANVERRTHGTRRDVEQHGEAGPRLNGKLLERVEETLRARGVEHASTARRGPVTDAGCSMLAVGGDHDDRVLALCAHLVEVLGDLRRRGDRVVAHHVEVDVLRGDRGHLVAALEVDDLLCRFGCERRGHLALTSSSSHG